MTIKEEINLIAKYHTNGMYFNNENLKESDLLNWSLLFQNFNEGLKIGIYSSSKLKDISAGEIFKKCKPGEFSSDISQNDILHLKDVLYSHSMWYELNLYHFNNASKQLKSVIKKEGFVKPLDFEGIYFHWFINNLKRPGDQVFYVNKDNYYRYLVSEDEKNVHISKDIRTNLGSIISDKENPNRLRKQDEETATKFIVLEKFLKESPLYKNLNEGDKDKVIAKILNIVPDTAKRYKNSNYKRGKPLITEENKVDAKDFFDKLKYGD